MLCLSVVGQGKPKILPNSPKSFDRQYKNLFKAYEKGNERALLERFRTFAIPEHWFTDEFGPKEGAKLSQQYAYRFRDFETDTVQEFNRVMCDYDGGCNRGQIKTTATKAKPPALSSSRVSLPPVEDFRIRHFSTDVGSVENANGTFGTCMCCNPGPCYDNAWISSFIYVDGAFRFAGSGTCRFWEPCVANQPIPESRLDTPLEPLHFNLMKKSQSRDLLAWMAKFAGKNQ